MSNTRFVKHTKNQDRRHYPAKDSAFILARWSDIITLYNRKVQALLLAIGDEEMVMECYMMF